MVDFRGGPSKMTPWRRRRGADDLPPSTVKRRNERYLLSTRLTAAIRGESGETKVKTHALDISESGIGTLAGEGWGVGSHVNLEVPLPVQDTLLEIQGVVRHRTGTRCGLEFLEVSPEQQQVLRKVCKYLAGHSGSPSP
jgi:c-di-GMP-binding flagellar brake protein YcgR